MSGDKEGKGQQADGPHLAGEESGGPERFFFSDSPGCRAVSKLASHDPSPFYPSLLTGTLGKLTPRSLSPQSPLLDILLCDPQGLPEIFLPLSFLLSPAVA